MSRSRFAVSVAGAVTGALLGILGLAFVVGIRALGSVDLVVTDFAASRARPILEVMAGSMYFALIVGGFVGGALVGSITYVLGRMGAPDAPRFPLKYLLPTAGITGSLMLYAVMRGAVGFGGSIEDGMITISVVRLTIGLALAGLVAGGVTAGTTDALARPAFLGLENEAWPGTRAAFVRESVRAMFAPLVGIGAAAVVAIGVSQLFLSAGKIGAVIVASVASAGILAGGALIAYRPWDRDGTGEESPTPG